MLYAPGHDVGMVLFGTQETSNALDDRNEGHCAHVKVVRTMSKIDLDFFRAVEQLEAEEEPLADRDNGNMLDALEVALHQLDIFCAKRKYRKRLFLITDGERGVKFAQ